MGRPRDTQGAERILAATRELLGEHGPACVGIDAIAEAAGVAKATIYRWWPSRDVLILDALVQMSDPAVRDETGTTQDVIRIQMRRLATLLSSRTGSMLREIVANAQGDDELATLFRDRFFTVRRSYALATLQRGVELGEVRSDISPDTLLDLLSGPIWQRFLLGHAPISRRAVDELVDGVWPAIALSTQNRDKR
jgi:AcrR family transcriptional regulator